MTVAVFDSPDPAQCAIQAKALYEQGTRGVILYISPGFPAGAKTVKKPQVDALHAAGIGVGFVCEWWGGSDNFVHHDINDVFGKRDGTFCGGYLDYLGAPDGTAIYPTVDNDTSPAQLSQLCLPYFRAFRAALPAKYKMGAYGCGALLFALEAESPKIMDLPWLSNALGWSRSREYLATSRAAITQKPQSRVMGIDIDPDVVTGDLAGAGLWTAPAAETPPVAVPAAATGPSMAVGGHDVMATCFGGAGDAEQSAYGGMVDPNSPGVALPYRFPDPRPKVKVIRGAESVICEIVDVGPHNTNDPYWWKAARPLAESQPGNHAGLDATPAVWAALGIKPSDPAYGLARFSWEFA